MDAAVLAALPIDATAFLVLFTRIGAVLMLLPAFSDDSVAPQIRLLMALGFTAALYGMLEPRVAGVVASDGMNLPMLVIGEFLTGLALGMIVKMMFSAIAIAGALISQQIGLSMAMMFDPSMGGQSALIGRLLGMAALLVCMAMGVHHLWIGAIVRSYEAFPVGGLPPAADFAQLAIRVTSQAMSLGVSLAAPLILYGSLFNIGLGLAARVAPSLQVFFIAQPLNLLLGMTVFATSIGAILMAFSTAMADFMNSGWGV